MVKISDRQVVFVGAMYVLDATLISVHSQMFRYAKNQIWVSHLIAAAVICLSLFFIGKVLDRFPGQDLYSVLVSRWSVPGRGIALAYAVFFFYILSRDMRMLVDFANVALLPNTPLAAIGAMVVLVVIVIARGGLEVMARITEMYAPLFIGVLFIIPLLLFQDFDVSLLMPFFKFDVPGILEGAWLVVSYVGEVLALPLLFAGRQHRYSYRGMLLGVGLLILLTMMTLLTLGVPIASRLIYPNYELARQLRLTDFLDRFDLPIVGLWLPTMLTKIGYSLYVVCHGLKRVFPELSGKMMVAPMGILAYGWSFWLFDNAVQLFNFNYTWPVYALCFELLLPVIFYACLFPHKSGLPGGAGGA